MQRRTTKGALVMREIGDNAAAAGDLHRLGLAIAVRDRDFVEEAAEAHWRPPFIQKS
jgi:hypothetical protein